MNAVEAHRIAFEAHPGYSEVQKEIEMAAKEGCFKAFHHVMKMTWDESKRLASKLEENGFTVEKDGDDREGYKFWITW